MDPKLVLGRIESVWDETIVPTLVDYIRIPNKSPHFDSDWEAHGYMDQAVTLAADWCRRRPIEGLAVEVVKLEGRTPVLFMEIPGATAGEAGEATVLLYGHLDKQPEMTGWREGLGPWEPVIEGDRLYGRGGADDGYAAFASLTAIEALQAQRIPHARCVVVIECCEESGSYDLPFYIEHLSERIGSPDLVICLDSGAGDYERLWLTTSLRGFAMGTLAISTVREGVHSGDASGIVPSSFRVARELLERIEDARDGRVKLEAMQVAVPEARVAQAHAAAQVLGPTVWEKFPMHPGVSAMGTDGVDRVLNRTWRPALSVTGAEGLPALLDAGNVLRPSTKLKLSMRIPPTCDPEVAVRALKDELERDPPSGARVAFENAEGAPGWNAPPLAGWLEEAIDESSRVYFGESMVQMGEGGTIPFMGMLGESFPDAQFVITGVLGPESNAHGPNEFLHVPTGKKVTACMAHVLARHWGVASDV